MIKRKTKGLFFLFLIMMMAVGKSLAQDMHETGTETKLEIQYGTIPFGTVSESVLNVQIRLKELGYYEDQELNPNVYDWGLQSAIDTFCKENNIAMADMEISRSLQKILFSDIIFARQRQEYTDKAINTIRPEGFRYVLGEHDMEIRSLQEKLNQLGYYLQEEYGYELDMDTLYAVNRCCFENRIYYSEVGITEETWNYLMNDEISANILPMPTPQTGALMDYRILKAGDTGAEVAQLQLRLIELGYAQNGHFELGICEEELLDAVRLFCEYNHIVFEGEIISQEIQTAIYQNTAAEYSVQADRMGLYRKLRMFLLEKYPVFQWRIAGFAIILSAIGIFTIFALLLVIVVTEKTDPEEELFSSCSLQGVSRPRTDAQVQGENITRYIDFSIRYQNEERRERIRFVDQLTIGRAADADIVLSAMDKGVSRCHCVLNLRAGNMILSDVSINGTYVNDKRFNKCECTIHSGDRIQIGRHMLVIRF